MRSLIVLATLSVFCAVLALVPDANAVTGVAVPLPVSKSDALKLAVPANVSNGALVFGGCKGCHDAGPSAINGVGPKLNGLVGRSAGSVPGYNYSAALVRAGKNGLVWTSYKLDAFLMAPASFLVGNKMPFAGVKDETARRDLIAYLKTLE